MAASQTLVSRVTGSYKSGSTRRRCLSGLNSEKPFLIFVDEFIMRPPGETYYFQASALGSLVAAHTGLNKTFHLHTRSLPAASLYDLLANYKASIQKAYNWTLFSSSVLLLTELLRKHYANLLFMKAIKPSGP